MQKTNLNLPKNPTLDDFQKYIKELEIRRGFDEESTLRICLKLGEEIGELFKAIRKREGISIDVNKTNYSSISEELADVFIYILSLANRYNLSLETSFRIKEEINKKRVWEA